MSVACLRPYLRGNPVHYLHLIERSTGWERADLIQALSPLSCYKIHGDANQVDRAWPARIAHLKSEFPLRCRLPRHVIPVYADHGYGCVVPFSCVPADEWDASDACARFEPDHEEEPSQGLAKLLARISAAWERRTGQALPLRWRVAYALSISIPVHAGDIEGRSMQFPLMLALLREAGVSMDGAVPWGDGPVFCTGPVNRSGAIEPARKVTEKLEGFIREFGPGRPALLTRSQAQVISSTRGELLDEVRPQYADSVDEVLGLPEILGPMTRLAGPPRLTEVDRLTRLMAGLARGVRFDDAMLIGEYLLRHVKPAPYEVRVRCGIAHLLLHQGKITESAGYLDRAEAVISSGARIGGDLRAHCAAIRAIQLLDAGDPRAALEVLAVPNLDSCTHLTRIEVTGTKSQALRAIGDYPGAVKAALRAVRLAKDGLASEAGRDLNYAVHALIRQAEAAPHPVRRAKLLDGAESYLTESLELWAPSEKERRLVHFLFCRHLRAELARVRGEPSEPGPPPEDVRAGWRHPWLFTLLSCSRNSANSRQARLAFATELVKASGSIVEHDSRREVFKLFDLVYRVWSAVLQGHDVDSARAGVREWCDKMASAKLPEWTHQLGQLLAEPIQSPEDWADRLCSAIYFH